MKDKRRFTALALLWTGFIITLAGGAIAAYGIFAAGVWRWTFEAGYYLALAGAAFTVIMIVYCFVTVIRHESEKRRRLAISVYVLSLLLTAVGVGNIAYSFAVERHAMGHSAVGAVYIGAGLLVAFIITAVMMMRRR